ncbi:hypothetical protein Tco_0922774 [Tanacetum coccineum]|uniref:Uncharacterized protein n=1 Tax=Tanacetum coccineum TaxID=301880 RepID=A0ABQ5CZ16_9ASTR
MMYYQIFRADGSSKNYKIFSEMLNDFDRQDVVDLYRVVLLMDTGISIYMMVEKKYPLTQEMLLRMLNRRLEVDHETTMAFELIRFIKAQLEDPTTPDYVPGPKHPPSPDYVSGPEHPPSLVYVLEPEYPEYLVLSDAKEPMEDQPLPDDASPIALSPGYVVDSDPKEDPEEDHADYSADGGDGDDESSDDDDDADDEDEEAFEDEDGDDEEEHLALANSSAVPVVDHVPSARDTEAFETDKSAPTPPSPISPQIVVPLSLTQLRRAWKTIPSPPLPVSSPPLPLPSPPTTSPTYAEAPLGYKAAGIRMRVASPPLLLPSTSHRTGIPEAEMPPRKRACFTTPASGFEVRESSAAAAARQLRPTLKADLRRDRVREMGYGITDT